MGLTKNQYLTYARLPKWLLPSGWPMEGMAPALATIHIFEGKVHSVVPSVQDDSGTNLSGCLVLPGLVEAHAHLDKTFTVHRLGELQPGLLNAIQAMKSDQKNWTYEDLFNRAEQALEQAYRNGVVFLRTHVDWVSEHTPLAWEVFRDLAKKWQSRVRLQRVALIPLGLLKNKAWSRQIANTIRLSDDSQMGGFIHSSNFTYIGVKNLIEAASNENLILDLHIDEELIDEPQGLPALLDILDGQSFHSRIVCGHVCALSSVDESVALTLLDRVAKHPITLVTLPGTNLLLQDARAGRTPRNRGLTLVNEAMQRNIPTMVATDNVQDAFCPLGEYDPVKALQLGVYSGHLQHAFDVWSQSICRFDWLNSATDKNFSLVGKEADFVIFDTKNVSSWPSNIARLVMRKGQFITNTSIFHSRFDTHFNDQNKEVNDER